MRRLAITVAALLLVAAPAAAAGGRLSVSVDRTLVSTKLGHTFTFHSTIANHSTAPASGLIAHLNVLSLRNGVYVDPEDWSSHRTRCLAPIPAGGSTTLTWRIKTVNAGSIGVYVAVLTGNESAARPTTGPTLRIAIADRRTLNSGRIVPLALGVPVLIGLALLVVRFRRSRHLTAPSP
jgi:hypothetical protein